MPTVLVIVSCLRTLHTSLFILVIVTGGGVGVDKASAVIHSERTAQTIGFAALRWIPSERG
jgi:hypothetical protein